MSEAKMCNYALQILYVICKEPDNELFRTKYCPKYEGDYLIRVPYLKY